jgi:uncharacterized protein YecE (DUF72 family)
VRWSKLERRARPSSASGMPGEPAVRIGTSGYVYRHWRGGVFYPAGLRAREELAWYAARFSTVELNYPFYRVPTSATFVQWREATPEDFLFAVKVNRVISHLRRLHDVAGPLDEFLGRARELGPKLGPLLVQLPPQMPVDLPRVARFLSMVPREERWALEVRHPSWQTADVYELLAEHAVALCIPVGGRLQPDLVTTAPFTYLRFHAGAGPAGGFTDQELRTWAKRLRALARSGKGIYAYFNNDREGHAVRDAARLRALLRSGR